MDLQRKTLGQLMVSALGFGKSADAAKADVEADQEQEAADEEGVDDDGDDDDQADDGDEAEQEEAHKKKATAAAKTKAAAGTVTLTLADYNALKAEAGQVKALKASNTSLKTKAAAWDAHQKAIGGVSAKADTTNEAPETEENAEAKEMKRLSERYKGMLPE
ncbi:hypothetical protein [Persicitalea jodogahamensis]|uniref:Uncharacterized protein n=1 Tax=Persicitalea jodogahamensis TaxID=402147 RepID=A0A8J3D2V2_9BACT|nr:hypothetical protein [Persicitalea jodogahamensis]GHB64002.1 hypothetical protein GCM10007390_17350 [Persicitalea jodogahamensis]